jgi:hypothetical protein
VKCSPRHQTHFDPSMREITSYDVASTMLLSLLEAEQSKSRWQRFGAVASA